MLPTTKGIVCTAFVPLPVVELILLNWALKNAPLFRTIGLTSAKARTVTKVSTILNLNTSLWVLVTNMLKEMVTLELGGSDPVKRIAAPSWKLLPLTRTRTGTFEGAKAVDGASIMIKP